MGNLRARRRVVMGIAVFIASLPMGSVAAQAAPVTEFAAISLPRASKVPACIHKGKLLAGKVYIEKRSQYAATFRVYQGSSKYSTDLSVFSTRSQYDARSCGLWHFVTSKYSADFSVYFVSSKYSADFSVNFVSSRYSAGVN